MKRTGGISLVITSNQLMYKAGEVAPRLGRGNVMTTISDSDE